MRHGRWKMFALALMVLLGPLGVSAAVIDRGSGWWSARRDSSGQAPEPASHADAVVQVYGARTVGWRGAFAVHTWISVKPRDGDSYRRYEVMGWGVDRGVPAVRVDRFGPDNYWFGARPDLLLDLRGAAAEPLIGKIEAAVRSYPYQNEYLTWPGPNSNTFIAYIAREVPELGLELPPHAIGKDYLPGGRLVDAAPSGTGLQVSLFGLMGVIVAAEEGVEFNLLGLTVGFDFNRPALKLPGLGRVGTDPSG